jgi:SNF2 family DNA or RNA helicase
MGDAYPMTTYERKAWPHQRVALQLFRLIQQDHDGILVHDSTGVGKTLQSLLWSLIVLRSSRTLILTKNIVKEQWADAIRDFIGTDQRITVVEGTISDQIRKASTMKGWVIGHWESLVHAKLGYLQRPWGAIIADEVQYIGNGNSKRGEAIHQLDATYRMAMSAHPFSNDVGELFNVLKFLYPRRYTSYWRFVHMHGKLIPKDFGGHDIEGARRPKLLGWEIAPFTIGRTKHEVFKTIPRINHAPALRTELTPKGNREYNRLRKQVFAELEALDGSTKFLPIINDLARTTRMRQYLIDPALVGAGEPSVKFAALWELYDEIYEPTVVFSNYRKALDNLEVYLHKKNKRLRIVQIHGNMTKVVRKIQKNFQAGNIDILTVVSSAGNEALNLGGHGYVVHLDLPWTPREFEQRNGRVDRPAEGTGKLVPTTSYRITVKGSYEDKMEKRLVKKHDTFRGVFTVNDLKELFE